MSLRVFKPLSGRHLDPQQWRITWPKPWVIFPLLPALLGGAGRRGKERSPRETELLGDGEGDAGTTKATCPFLCGGWGLLYHVFALNGLGPGSGGLDPIAVPNPGGFAKHRTDGAVLGSR